jgi:murein L,D-transpeptidase YafK
LTTATIERRVTRLRRWVKAWLALAALALAGTCTIRAHEALRPHLLRVSIRAPGAFAQSLQPVTINRSGTLPMADHIVVRKSLRRLYLMRGNTVLAVFKVHLGLDPVGQKERSGDFRTPEGRYFLTRRNPRSEYFLSIQVSYPNRADLARARRHGWNAGGSIMIHGLPDQITRPPQYYEKYDWTDGCIALSDSDMLAVWLMTRYDTPIDILP